MRRLSTIALLCVALLVAGGCSRLFRAFIHNRLDEPVAVTIAWEEPLRVRAEDTAAQTRPAKPEVRLTEADVAVGNVEDRGLWFGSSPPSFEVRAHSAKFRLSRVFRQSDYLPEMNVKSSMGRAFRVVVEPAGIRLEEASAWERGDPQVWFLGTLAILCPAFFLFLLLKFARSAIRIAGLQRSREQVSR